MSSYFATCPAGLENLLAKELTGLGIADAKATRGGVAWSSDTLEDAYRVCLHSRLHQRMLLILSKFSASTPDELYAKTQELDWSEHLDVDGTFRIDAKLRDTELGQSHFAALRVKDAIADQFREKFQRRPSVQIRSPDLRIDLFVHKQNVQLAMDLSGSWQTPPARGSVGDAMDAAAVLGFSNYRAGDAIVVAGAAHADVIALAGIAVSGLAPGLFKHDFGFITWQAHVPALWRRVCDEARAAQPDADTMSVRKVFVYEPDPKALKNARNHAREMGSDQWVQWLDQGPWQMQPPPGQGVLLVCTSAYSKDSDAWETAAKRRFAGWKVIHRAEQSESGASRGWAQPELAKMRISRGKLVVQLREYRMDGVATAAVAAQAWGAADSQVDFPAAEQSEAISPWARATGAVQENLYNKALSGGSSAAADNGSTGDSVTPRPKYDNSPGLTVAPVEDYYSGAIAEDLSNRLRKNLKHLGRWARRNEVDCYRLYDADMPNYAAAIDLYQSEQLWVVIQEYAAPPEMPVDVAQQRLLQIVASVRALLELPNDRIVVKQRQRQRGAAQYEKRDRLGRTHVVRDGNLKVLVNFTDYLDTGLFLDHREVRAELGRESAGKHVLNLFAYTGVATLHMVAGGAKSSTTVDMSRTYLDWAQRNLLLNKLQAPEHRYIQADCLQWMADEAANAAGKRYGLIFLDPPTFSSSKRMEATLDIQRDHADMVRSAMALLRPGGVLYFSNNFRRFKMDRKILADFKVDIITARSMPEDFKRRANIHHCFRITT